MTARDPSSRRWPAAGGDVAALMQADGWESTALGPPETWPRTWSP